MKISSWYSRHRRPGNLLAGAQVHPRRKPGSRPNGMPGRRILLGTWTVTICLLIVSSAQSSDGPGTTSSPFLKIPVSARATAMGGAYSAISGDIAVIDYNPAGLAGIARTHLQASYLDYLEDTSLQAISLGFPVRLGPPTPLLEVPVEGDFEEKRLSVGFEYRLFKAKDEARNSIGAKTSDFDVQDQLISLGLAYPILPSLSLGATGKMIGNKVQDKSVSTMAFDGGVLAKLGPRWSAALAIQNVGSGKALETQKDPLPMVVRSGLTYQTPRWLISADISSGRDSITRTSSGFEWAFNPFLRFRGGAYHATTLEFSGGLGLMINGPRKSTRSENRSSAHTIGQVPEQNKNTTSTFSNVNVGLDYGLTTNNDLGITHNVTLRILY